MHLPSVRLQVVEELAHVAAVLARVRQISRVLLLVLPPPLVPDHGGPALVTLELLVRQLVLLVPRVGTEQDSSYLSDLSRFGEKSTQVIFSDSLLLQKM